MGPRPILWQGHDEFCSSAPRLAVRWPRQQPHRCRSSCEPSCWVRFTVPLANRLRETLAEHVEFSVHLHHHAPADDDGRAIVVTGDKVTADKDRDLHQSEEAGLGGDPGDLDSGSIVVTCTRAEPPRPELA